MNTNSRLTSVLLLTLFGLFLVGANLTHDQDTQVRVTNGSKLELEDDDGSDSITIKAASATTAHDMVLPAVQGGVATFLKNDGSGNLSWDSASVEVMTTRGDMIYRDATNTTTRLPRGTDNQILRGDGTDTLWGSVDDPAFFTTGAAASASDIGIVTTGNQSFNGEKTFIDSPLRLQPTTGNASVNITPASDTDTSFIRMGTLANTDHGEISYLENTGEMGFRASDEVVLTLDDSVSTFYNSNNDTVVRIQSDGANPDDQSSIEFADAAEINPGYIRYDHSSNIMQFRTASGSVTNRINNTNKFEITTPDNANCGLGNHCTNDGFDVGTGTCEGGNCTSCSVTAVKWSQDSGSVVDYSFNVTWDPGLSGDYECRVTPFTTTTFSNVGDVVGACSEVNPASATARLGVEADVGNNAIQLHGWATDGLARTFGCSGHYRP